MRLDCSETHKGTDFFYFFRQMLKLFGHLVRLLDKESLKNIDYEKVFTDEPRGSGGCDDDVMPARENW